MLSKGLVTAANKLSQYITTGSHQLQSNMTPAQTPVRVDPRLQSGAQTAKKVSVGVLKVSEYVGELARGRVRFCVAVWCYVKTSFKS